MSALDQITGLIPVALGAGIVLKVTEKALPQQAGRPKKNGKKRVAKKPLGFGDFSNVGL